MRIALAPMMFVVSGCSLLYNPNNLTDPPIDAAADAAIDAFFVPDMPLEDLALTGVDTPVLVEGTGAGGSAPAILVVRGKSFDPATLTIAITAFDGTSDISVLQVDTAKLEVGETYQELAVPVTIAVDPLHDHAAAHLRLQVTVSQMAPSGKVTATLPDAATLEIAYLDELTDTSAEYMGAHTLSSGVHEYSSIAITQGLTASDRAAPLQLRARAGISITGAISVNASGKSGGPGGADGGLGGPAPLVIGTTVGSGGAGAGAGSMSGGGAGFGAAAIGANAGPAAGSPALPALAPPHQGSGGAGGDGATLVVGTAGGDGGGGGGSIELAAGGDIVVGDVSSTGGTGGTGANNGGGGSGGAILIRGRSVTTGAVTVNGGPAGAGGGTAGGAGAVGRIRIDSGATIPTTNPAAFRGPWIDPDMPRILRTALPSFTVHAEKNKPYNYVISNAAGTMTRSGRITSGTQGVSVFQLPVGQELFFGKNTICLIVDGADAGSPAEAQNCFDVAFLYKK